MTPDEALESVARQPWRDVPIEAAVLAAEVRRLRAAVEAVMNLSSPSPPFLSRSGDLIIRDEVLAILEPKP